MAVGVRGQAHVVKMKVHPAYFETRFRSDGPADDWPASFVIVTAYATTGEIWTDAQNLAADNALEAMLRERGGWLRRITGYSPSSGHSEPGWAFDAPIAEGLDIGRRFRQDAIYAVEGGRLIVFLCAEGGARADVGVFAGRVD